MTTFEDCHKQGFLYFLHSSQFSDIELILDGTVYKAHKVLLAAKSKFLHKLLTSDFREAKEGQIILPVGVFSLHPPPPAQ